MNSISREFHFTEFLVPNNSLRNSSYSLHNELHCPSPTQTVSLENHLTGVYTCLLLHMDDSNEIIRNAALETLRITGSKCPKLCLSLTTKAAEKNVHKDPCKQLIEHLQTLKL